MRLPRLLAGFVGNCGVALAAGMRAAEQLDSLELRHPSPQLSRNFSLPSSFASVVSTRFSFAFVPRFSLSLYSNAITITFFSRHNVFRFPSSRVANRNRGEEKEETGYIKRKLQFTNVNFSILSRIINKTW